MKLFHNRKGDETGGSWSFAIKLVMIIAVILTLLLLFLTPLGPFLLNLPEKLFGGM